jgi:hypothetical protein
MVLAESLDVHGVLESILWFFNQIKVGIFIDYFSRQDQMKAFANGVTQILTGQNIHPVFHLGRL